jgi:CIC family chloride channel protein
MMITMALLVGAGTGFGAVAFRQMLSLSHQFFFGTLGRWLSFMGSFYIIILPALGGLLAGMLITFLAPETKGAGVAGVMEALASNGGRIRPPVILIKPIATALCIGSGGSAGRQGPIVQTGAAIGSNLGQVLHLSDKRTKSLAAYGAAGGIAATFNAPLTGAMFALEVLLKTFGPMEFAGVVISSVTASVIGHAYLGNVLAFPLPFYHPISAWELPIYGLLGVTAALVGIGFTYAHDSIDRRLESWDFPPYLKSTIGGLFVGLIGFWFPQLFGIGYQTIQKALYGQLPAGLIIVLGTLKVLTTNLTIGSGSSGGVFAPLLFVGALLGALFAQIASQWPLTNPSLPAVYALVGMAAVYGAANRAPITAILTLLEMSRGYQAILPLMLSTVISVTVARQIYSESIYTIKLKRRGVTVHTVHTPGRR